ncbi:MFS transporter, partial [Chloroflexota bacterium]
PYFSSVGITRYAASMVALVLPVATISGRLSSGWLADRFGSRQVFVASTLLVSVGMLFFAYVNTERMWLLLPFIITFSLGWGFGNTTRLSLLRECFGRGSFGKILGFMSGIAMLGNMAGAPLAGWVFDTWGSYQGVWLGYSVLVLAGTVLAFTIPSPSTSIPRPN